MSDRKYNFEVVYSRTGFELEKVVCEDVKEFNKSMKYLWENKKLNSVRVYVYSERGFERVNNYRRGRDEGWILIK